MEYIQYSLFGEVRDEQHYSIDRLLTNPVGEKVKVTLVNDTECIGFWDTYVENNKLPEKIKISRYDLDEEKGELRSSKSIEERILTKDIVKVEAILYSNPRWRVPPTNKFKFIEKK